MDALKKVMEAFSAILGYFKEFLAEIKASLGVEDAEGEEKA